jgi:hypothetical protein
VYLELDHHEFVRQGATERLAIPRLVHATLARAVKGEKTTHMIPQLEYLLKGFKIEWMEFQIHMYG